MPHLLTTRIYYEDTDAAGIVYYANYLKFAERARTEWLRGLGFNQSEILSRTGIGFVVRRAEVDFLSPARLDDVIVIETRLREAGKVRIKVHQNIKRGEKTLVTLEVILAAMDTNGKAARIPKEIAEVVKAEN